MFRLSVADNGVGLPKDIDFRRAESLGFHCWGMLTEQLNGTNRCARRWKDGDFASSFPPPREEETEAAAGT